MENKIIKYTDFLNETRGFRKDIEDADEHLIQ